MDNEISDAEILRLSGVGNDAVKPDKESNGLYSVNSYFEIDERCWRYSRPSGDNQIFTKPPEDFIEEAKKLNIVFTIGNEYEILGHGSSWRGMFHKVKDDNGKECNVNWLLFSPKSIPASKPIKNRIVIYDPSEFEFDCLIKSEDVNVHFTSGKEYEVLEEIFSKTKQILKPIYYKVKGDNGAEFILNSLLFCDKAELWDTNQWVKRPLTLEEEVASLKSELKTLKENLKSGLYSIN